jgi:hypothetical protein
VDHGDAVEAVLDRGDDAVVVRRGGRAAVGKERKLLEVRMPVP